MRIIAGEFRGRKLESLRGDATRPTLDQVKESMFNALGQFFSGGKVLDLYAGSGNLGLEALSRGCDEAYFVDKNYQAIRIIKQNITLLQLNNRSTVLKMDAKRALLYFKTNKESFDYIFLDPPYHHQQLNQILTQIMDDELLNDNGTIICESGKEEELFSEYQGLFLQRTYAFGATKVWIYKKEGKQNE